MDDFTPYELEVAKIITDHPGILCLDILGMFRYGPDIVCPSINIETEDKTLEFSYNTSRVDVCQVELPTTKERELLNRKFKFKFIYRVVSKDTCNLPDAETILVDGFPITEKQVLFVCKTFLKAVGYEHDSFIWGTKLIGLD
jgi:hypothetical protein